MPVNQSGNYAQGQTLLVLGAGPDQIPMFEAARKAGIRTIGADANLQALSRPLADRFLNIQSREASEVIALLDGENIDGVVSPSNDSFHQTIRDLCKLLNLPNRLSQQAVDASCDKGYFSKLAEELGIYAPLHCSSTELNELKHFVSERPFPLIVKPADSSGSRGVSYLTDINQLDEAFEKAVKYSPRKLIIVEDYIAGEQYSVEAFRLKGRCILAAVSKRGHTGPPDFLITQHRIGFPLKAEFETKLVSDIEMIADALDVSDGVFNFDIVDSPERGICFLEMGARLSGNGFPALVREAYDVDLMEWCLRQSLGYPLPDINTYLKPKRSGIQQILTSHKNGVLKNISGLNDLERHPAFRQKTLFIQPGELVKRFRRTVDRVGLVLLAHEDPAILSDGFALMQNIRLEIEDALHPQQEVLV